MFNLPDVTVTQIQYRAQIIHFGASFKNFDDDACRG